MISIETTPRLNGITIQGDFDDLNSLYDAVSGYINFYVDGVLQEMEADYRKKHGIATADMSPDQREKFFALNHSVIIYYEDLRENVLGLCYDIRHAYQGDRGVCLVQNGLAEPNEELPSSNLQFSVEVLYPLAFYYLFCLQSILNDTYRPEWLNGTGDFPKFYTEWDIQFYRAVLGTFVSLIWKNLEELFGRDFESLYTCFTGRGDFRLPDRAYLTGICNYLVADNCGKLGKAGYVSFKKSILLVLAYDSMDADDLFDSDHSEEYDVTDSRKQYKKALEHIRKNATRPYVTIREFLSKAQKAAADQEEIDEAWITEIFGDADWEHLEW